MSSGPSSLIPIALAAFIAGIVLPAWQKTGSKIALVILMLCGLVITWELIKVFRYMLWALMKQNGGAK